MNSLKKVQRAGILKRVPQNKKYIGNHFLFRNSYRRRGSRKEMNSGSWNSRRSRRRAADIVRRLGSFYLVLLISTCLLSALAPTPAWARAQAKLPPPQLKKTLFTRSATVD
jgi:hypothetical protein